MQGVVKGLNSRRPAIFNIYTPCPVEHGLPDEWAPEAAKLALESRAFPFLTYDPDGGADIADCLTLDGNPALDQVWPTYTLSYVDDEGAEQSEDFPLSIADWAFTETRFRKHFTVLKAEEWDEDAHVLFHEFIALPPAEREGRRPYIWTLGKDRRRSRVAVSKEIVFLAEERLNFWHQIRELAGLDVPDDVRERMNDEAQARFEARVLELQAEYEAKMARLRADLPAAVARRMAQGLLAHGGGDRTVADLLGQAFASPLDPVTAEDVAGLEWGGGPSGGNGPGAGNGAGSANGGGGAAVAAPVEAEAPAAAPSAAEAAPDDDDDALALEPWIDTAMCTSCNECIQINGQLFAYNEQKQAYIKDPKAGTFAQLVQAAEKCPAAIIHPGTPLDPREKNLEKWIKRAEPFN
jgi:pyruvate-ferredoxin/flavodoxin oxidoreductase